jgi:FMN phosphatase YigB (HAD superfamily)
MLVGDSMKIYVLSVFVLIISTYSFIVDTKPVLNTEQEANAYYLYPVNQPITPETTIFAFDLHDVLFEKKPTEMVGYSLRGISRGMFFYLCNPFFWYTARKISSQTVIWEDFFNQLVEKYPGLKRFENDFYGVANAQKPIQKMVDIITQLKTQGFRLYILSNIGGKTFELFKEKFPDLFAHFSGAYTPCEANNYNCKPEVSFFTEFKEYLVSNGEQDKQCIFLDDLEPNLQAALTSNGENKQIIMGGIYCTSPERVESILRERLILMPQDMNTQVEYEHK